MSVPLERDYIAPGDSLPLEIIFYSSRYTTRIYKAPAIYTNEDSVATIVRWVKLWATVCSTIDTIQPIRPEPSKVSFLYAYGSTIDSANITLRNVTDEDISFEIVDRPDLPIVFEVPSTIKANNLVTGFIKIDSDTAIAAFKKSFTLEFSDSAKSRLTIPLKCSNYVGTGGDVNLSECPGD